MRRFSKKEEESFSFFFLFPEGWKIDRVLSYNNLEFVCIIIKKKKKRKEIKDFYNMRTKRREGKRIYNWTSVAIYLFSICRTGRRFTGKAFRQRRIDNKKNTRVSISQHRQNNDFHLSLNTRRFFNIFRKAGERSQRRMSISLSDWFRRKRSNGVQFRSIIHPKSKFRLSIPSSHIPVESSSWRVKGSLSPPFCSHKTQNSERRVGWKRAALAPSRVSRIKM